MLDAKAQKNLKKQAHALSPVVSIGQQGLTENVLKEIDSSLIAHELMKVKLPAIDKSERQKLSNLVSEHCCASIVQLIGRVLTLYRKNENTK